LDLEARWQSALLTGAVADLVGKGDSGNENGSSLLVLGLGGGASADFGEVIPGAVAARQGFATDDTTALRSRFAGIADRCGADLVDVRSVTAISTAPIIVLRATPAGTVSTCDDLLDRFFKDGSNARYEGWELTVINAAGTPVVRTTFAGRSGIGSSWGDAEILGELGIVHGTPPPGLSPQAISVRRVALSRATREWVIRLRLKVPANSRVSLTLRRGVHAQRVPVRAAAGRYQTIAVRAPVTATGRPLRRIALTVAGFDARGRALNFAVQLTLRSTPHG
jgi:hypothetical protein